MAKDFIELTPQEVNDFLLKDYGISIFKFAQVIAWTVMYSGHKTGKDFLSAQDTKEIEQDLMSLDKRIFKSILDIHGLFLGPESKALFRKEIANNKQAVLKHYGLDKFYELHINMTMDAVKEAKQFHKKGRFIDKKSLIAAAWGKLVYQNTKNTKWELLAKLYMWFWKHLENYNFYSCLKPPVDLKPSSGLINYLTVQFHRYKDKEIIKDILLEQTANEGITIFGKGIAYADPKYHFFFHFLKENRGLKPSDLDKKYINILKLLKGEKRAKFPKSEIDAYFFHIVAEYGKHPGFKKPVPLIIFPDLSYFSSSF